MLRQYLLSQLYEWAINHSNFRGSYRLGRWTVAKRLSSVQEIGQNVGVFGPIKIENAGKIRVGADVEFRSSWHNPIGVFVSKPDATLEIDDQTFINWGVTIGVAGSVVIGKQVLIGDDCIIYDTDWHSVGGNEGDVISKPTVIGNGVWLGARAVVLKGVTIGDNTVVAANATVTRDLPSQVLATGTPARPLRTIDRQRYVS